ncbi:MAG: phenylacetate-CoA oxygenase subunit PaaJ [Chitinophagaceae bacterium]|nr:phenylacetate-CoA oxygenase subunit PaaJ [Chitinophagaceae bacterium]MBL0199059.1 phenylacetate-CoA oxygenase subunit PaaJ [Chitinophagaceae bacterium]
MVTASNISTQTIWKILEQVPDPEVPVLTIADLGIIRDVKLNGDEVEVVITPTYTGCPAMDMIAMNIRMALIENGYSKIKITSVLSPAWTTDWMSEAGKIKLKEYGIAAPDKRFTIPADGIECPLCNSTNTRLISEFGSTACKALYQCNDCKEPFDFFKCH